jgi:LPS-assembly protein
VNRKRGMRGRINRITRSTAIPVVAALSVAAGIGSSSAQTTPPRQVLLRADEITYDSDTDIVTAQGHVEVSDEDRTVLADQLTYDEKTDTVTATGHVSLQDASGNVSFADRAELTQGLREGTIQGLAALIGQSGRLAANSGERHEGRFTIAHGAVYTPCVICQEEGEHTPLWEVRAARIIHDQLEKEIYFQNASFQFLGTTVFYLPFFSQPDPSVKYKTGLLLPDAGSIGALGPFVKIPYYVSFSPSSDLTLDPFITWNAGKIMQAEYRERFDSGGGLWLQGTAGYDPSAHDQPGETTWMSSLFGSGRIPITDGWRTGFDVQLSSNVTYLHRYEISNSDRLTNDLFTDDVEGRSRAALVGYFFQSLRPTDEAAQIPMALPVMSYTYIPEDRVLGGRLKLDTSALYLNRSQGTDMLRGSADADWRLPYTTGNGQLISLETFLRGDAYYVGDATFDNLSAPKNTETIGRALGFGMLEWRWPFVGQIGGKIIPDTTLVVEPIAQFIEASGGGNPLGLPDEDSRALQIDATNLFSANPSPGLDLWLGGPRSNAGVRATALLPEGSVQAMLGEQYRFTADSTLPSNLGLTEGSSNIVGQFKIDFPPNISLTHEFSIDPRDGSVRSNEVYLRARRGLSVIELSYLKLPPSTADPSLGEQEQINASATVILYRNWGVFGEVRRDLAKGEMLESGLGLTYDDDCFVAALGFHRRYTTILNLPPASSVIFHVGLKTGFKPTPG